MIRSIDLNKIIDFVRVVDLGNFTRAAEAMNERKAKLSRNLAILEKELGVQLVYRTTRQFKLTDIGQQFYLESKRNLENLESSVLKVQNKDQAIQGRIKITAPDDLGRLVITPLIHEFCLQHPKIDFEIHYTNQVLDIVKFGIDIAFRVGRMKDSTLLHKKAGYIELILVAAPKYLEKMKAPLTIEELHQHQIIGLTSGEKLQWNLTSKSASKRLTLKPHIIANSFLAVLEFVILGQGIAFIPRFVADEFLKSGQLTQILKTWNSEGGPVQITLPHQKNIPRNIRLFFDYSAKRLNEIL